MRIFKIPKRNGEFRTIYAPSRKEKLELRRLLDGIEHKVRKVSKGSTIQGFTLGRSPVTNALQHIGYSYTVSFDLKDFFDSVTPDKLNGKLTEDERKLVFVDGAARQGLPTSPAVANLSAIPLDTAILKFFNKHSKGVYTRYADDLTFSYNEEGLTKMLMYEVPKIVSRSGFKVNENKTSFQDAKSGRRLITGVGVGQKDIHPTRAVKRKLRAAKHQGNIDSQNGLKEWCRLKQPKPKEVIALNINKSEVDILTKFWKLPKIDFSKVPEKKTEIFPNNIIITGDPVYTLGMSTWTSGWTNCMSQPDGLDKGGSKRKGCISWVYLKGTRIAAVLSDKEKVIGGISRKVILSRVLVHELRNGVFVYDKIYGHLKESQVLERFLMEKGYIDVTIARRRFPKEKVVGCTPDKNCAYLDRLKSYHIKATEGCWKGTQVTILHL